MSTFEWVALCLGMLLMIATLARTFHLRRRNVPLWTAHLLIAMVMFLSVEEIYLPVDAALGGWNAANLISRLAVAPVFLGLCTQVLQGLDRPDLLRLVSGPAGLAVLSAGALGVVCSFVMVDAHTSSMGLNAYQEQVWVGIYRGCAGIYPAYCSVIMLQALRDDSRRGPGLKTHSIAKRSLSLGFALAPVVAVLSFSEVSILPVRPLVDLLTYASIASVLFGTGTMFIRRSLRTQLRTSRLTA